jgi:hypothetical protein
MSGPPRERVVKRIIHPWPGAGLAILMIVGCTGRVSTPGDGANSPQALQGAWRSQIRFSNGAFAQMKDLQFMYVFNQGGTLTESSNYDAAPPVPPAYGVWRAAGPGQFEAKYIFYITAAPKAFDELKSGGGWNPMGFGVFDERIRLSADGRTYTSSIEYSAFGPQGEVVEGGGRASGNGTRIAF